MSNRWMAMRTPQDFEEKGECYHVAATAVHGTTGAYYSSSSSRVQSGVGVQHPLAGLLVLAGVLHEF